MAILIFFLLFYRLSLDESNPGFSRDGFGRQSMSEKRHAHLDARNTDTYQRTKKAREDKDKNNDDDDEYMQKSHHGNGLGIYTNLSS